MRTRETNGEAVSEVVGEMLMIALVLIIVAIFSATVGNYLPEERDPSITIMATANDSHIVLWHKGGDWIRSSDFTVTVTDGNTQKSYTTRDDSLAVIAPSDEFTDASFTLGGRIVVPHEPAGAVDIRMVTDRSVVFSGSVVP